jgi:DNA-binding protein H-NS
MGSLRRLLFVCALLLLGYGVGHAQSPDVGLINQLAGDVSYANSAGSGLARAFMKMRQGDRFTVAAGAQVRVVYFQNGRQETWRGPASFRSGTEHSESITGTVYEVAHLPVAVPQKIQRIPELIQMAKLGGVQVRGVTPKQQASLEQQAEVAAARTTYAQLSQQLPQEDITPELYLFTVLQDYLLYDDMKTVVDEMLRRQPGNREAEQLADWVRVRIQVSR